MARLSWIFHPGRSSTSCTHVRTKSCKTCSTVFQNRIGTNCKWINYIFSRQSLIHSVGRIYGYLVVILYLWGKWINYIFSRQSLIHSIGRIYGYLVVVLNLWGKLTLMLTLNKNFQSAPFNSTQNMGIFLRRIWISDQLRGTISTSFQWGVSRG